MKKQWNREFHENNKNARSLLAYINSK